MTRKMMGVIYRAFKEGRLTDVDKELPVYFKE